jgi:hypothetical protein
MTLLLWHCQVYNDCMSKATITATFDIEGDLGDIICAVEGFYDVIQDYFVPRKTEVKIASGVSIKVNNEPVPGPY